MNQHIVALESGRRANGADSHPSTNHGPALSVVVSRTEPRAPTPVARVARDSTDHADLEHQLLERHRMAALSTLSAGVAHQINNPLTYLLVNMELLLRKMRAAQASDEPMAELESGMGGLAELVHSVQDAIEGANRIKQVVSDLQTFAEGHVERRGMVDVCGILESASQLALHEISRRARLSKTFGRVPFVAASEARLGQVFLQLLLNAAEAIPEGQDDRNEVRVATYTDEHGNAVVEVSDTGVGVAPENVARLFDPFFTTKDESGRGLGLSISQGIVKSLGGQISVTSVPGQGTTFRVVLRPAARGRGDGPKSSREAREPVRRHVLIIDDERLVGESIARALSDENDVEVVTDAEEAVRVLSSGARYDVVLCDLMMPVFTGMDLYAQIVRRAPQLAARFVFMTGGTFSPRARAFVESLVTPCLQKPLDMSSLRAIVARSNGS